MIVYYKGELYYTEEKALIEIKNLKIAYINDLSLDIPDGNTYAVFLGKGQGKTLLASAIAGAISFDGGEIRIDGNTVEVENAELKRNIGFYSADVKMLGFMNVEETLKFFGSVRGANEEKITMQTEEALGLVGLTELVGRSVSSLDVYQRARLGIATTLMGKTSLLIYDDIFKGLNESETEDVAELLKMISSKKRMLLICSSPAAASKCCTHAIFVENGKVALSGSIEDIEAEINKTREMYLGIKGDEDEIVKKLLDMSEIVNVKVCGEKFKIEYHNDPQIKDKLFAAMAEISSPILSYEETELSLVDVYHSLITDKIEESEGGSEAV